MSNFFEKAAFARAGLLGNPSDGYFGKTIALSIRNFSARVSIGESPDLRIEAGREDLNVYSGLPAFLEHVGLYGYYGGVRLIKAALKKFMDACHGSGIALPDRNFALRYQSDIPRQLGLGGSSAIIVAAMRALEAYFGIALEEEALPTIVLAAERDELGINAGFMDRVIQVYGGCVYMDLNREEVERTGRGSYLKLHPGLVPPLYLAYKPVLGKVSGTVLNPIRLAYDSGDRHTHETLERIAAIAEEGKDVLLRGDHDRLFHLMNENFDCRSRIMPISRSNMEMVEAARRCGASAKFAGSGGAIIGMYRSDGMYENLVSALSRLDAVVIKPDIG
jgi:glucuronokinase